MVEEGKRRLGISGLEDLHLVHNKVLYFNKTTPYGCSDAGSFRYFKFNATDSLSTTNTTSETLNTHYIDQDKVMLVYVSGNESSLNAHDPSDIRSKGHDIDNSSYLLSQTLNVKFNVTQTSLSGANRTINTSTRTSSISYNVVLSGRRL